MTLVVVTEQDIRTSRIDNPFDSPVGKAASRAFGRPIQSHYGLITDGIRDQWLPRFVRNWLLDFHDGKPVPRIWFYV